MNKKNIAKRIVFGVVIFLVVMSMILLANCPDPSSWYSDIYNYDSDMSFSILKDNFENTTLDRSVDTGIVYNDLTNDIMTFEDVTTDLAKGDSLTLRINRTQQVIIDVSADYYGYEVSGKERLIYCKATNSTVGAGDSGSPLFYGNKIIGILCYGISGDSTLFIARAIEDVISIDSTKSIVNTPNKSTTVIEPIGLSKFVDLSPSLLNFPYIKKKIDTRFSDDYSTSLGEQVMRGETSSGNINAGLSIGLVEVMGDLVNYYAIGTASYVKDNVIYALGHSYDNLDKTKMMVTDAKMIMMAQGDYVFKLAKITGNIIGDFALDRDFGIKIERKYPDIIELKSKIVYGSEESTCSHKLSKIYYSTYWLETILASQFYYLVNSDELYDNYDISFSLLNGGEKIIEASYAGQFLDFLYCLDYDLDSKTFNKFSDAEVQITIIKKE